MWHTIRKKHITLIRYLMHMFIFNYPQPGNGVTAVVCCIYYSFLDWHHILILPNSLSWSCSPSLIINGSPFTPKSVLVLSFLFLKNILFYFIFRERGREGERGRETWIGCLSYAPWLGTEPKTQDWALTRNLISHLSLCRTTPTYWATLVRAQVWSLVLFMVNDKDSTCLTFYFIKKTDLRKPLEQR